MSSNRVKHLLLAILAVFAVSAGVSASASAHEFFVEGKAVTGTERFEFTSTSGTSTLEAESLAIIECKKDTDKGFLEAKGATIVTIKYTECKVFGPKKEAEPLCKVTEPIEVIAADHLTIFEYKLGDLFEPETSAIFATIEITGAECLLKGKYEVTGKQQCKLPEAETEKVTHEVVCEPPGSELHLRTAPSKFTSTDTVEVAGKKWSARIT